MLQNAQSIDDFMNIDDSTLDFFNAPAQSNASSVYYKTPIELAKSEDGHYRSQIRLLWNPYDYKRSLVKSVAYSLRDQDGFFQAISLLSNDDRNCPIFKSWKKLWFSGDEGKKGWAKAMYDKSESTYCLIQVIDDQNQPELKGQFKLWKLPKAVLNQVIAKLKPAADSGKMSVPVLDFLLGPVLSIDVTPGPDDKANPTRKKREIKYDLCEFETEVTSIIKEDGSPLFEDEEIATIEDYWNRKIEVFKALAKVKKATTEAAKTKAEGEYKKKVEAVNEVTEDMRPLYTKAVEYLKEINVPDVQKERGYTPWSPQLTARVNAWIAQVAEMQDPANTGIGTGFPGPDAPATAAPSEDALPTPDDPTPFDEGDDSGDDDLPF